MDKFIVVWHKSAEDHLAELWITSLAPNTVTRSADSIEQALRENPDTLGDPLWNNTRIVYKYPLQVLFRVRPGDRIVEVLRVRLDVSAG